MNRATLKILLTIIFLFTYNLILSQSLEDFEKVDSTKIQGLSTHVYFHDPLKALIEKHPNFDSKENKAKHRLLSEYLHNNPLYVFETREKDKVAKSYWLVGNPRKTRERNYFNLEIRNPDNSIDKIVDQLNVGGSFFEHMFIFQTPQGKQSVGKGIQIWGYITMVNPYQPIKEAITKLIEKDLTNSIPEEVIAKKEVVIEPLFEYQTCGLSSIKRRSMTKNIYQYDSIGNIRAHYPSTNYSTNLYVESTSKDMLGVAYFPFFSKNDKQVTRGDTIFIQSEIENINFFFRDLKVISLPGSDSIDRIEGRRIIYGSKNGPERDERYMAKFEQIGDCRFPKTIKFYPHDDLTCKRPRMVIEIEYELK